MSSTDDFNDYLNEFNIFLFTTIFINIDINIFKDLKHFLIPQTNI